jgi:hypothetical protein
MVSRKLDVIIEFSSLSKTEKPPHFRAGGLPVCEMNFTLLSTTSATEVLPTLRAGGLPVCNVSDGGGGRERWDQQFSTTMRLEARRGLNRAGWGLSTMWRWLAITTIVNDH